MSSTVSIADERSTQMLATARGRWLLVLLASVGFLDVVDASIVNVALPDIRSDLGFSIQGLQWVVSGYLLTYGGFMLLGGRMADLLGRRRILLAGTAVFATASLVCGLAGNPGFLVAARLTQGLGAALMVPAALSLLTTTFVGPERTKVLAVWGATAALGGAVGVLGGGLFTAGPGWRWIFYVNPPISVVLMLATVAMFPRDRHRTRLSELDVTGGVLITGAMLLLVHALVTAPDNGWGSARTILQFFGTAVVFGLFLAVESATPRPLIPLSIFRIRGLAAADATALIGVGGFVPMFFFLTFYMQTVLGYSPIRTGVSYLPITAGIAVSATIASGVIARIGTRPVIVVGAVITGVGLYLLAHLRVHGHYASDVLPGIVVAAIGIGGVFVGTTTAANDGVPASVSGLAAALVNASQQTGGALGLAIFSALATSRTNSRLADGAPMSQALTSGFHVAFGVAALFLTGAAVIAVRTANTRGELPSSR